MNNVHNLSRNGTRVMSSDSGRQYVPHLRQHAAGDDPQGRLGLSVDNATGTQSETAPARAEKRDWKPILAGLQRMYDKGWFKPRLPRRLRQLWEAARNVRDGLAREGVSQDALRLKCNALQVKGVIYAIWSPRCTSVYVGQTSSSAYHRFQQHVWKAHHGSTLPLHRAMMAIGFEQFFIFPLERVQYTHRQKSSRRAEFEKVATPRERYWIERLHSYSPRGFNLEYCGRRRHRPHRRNNPMKRFRTSEDQRIDVVANDEEEASQSASPAGRWYASRDFVRRCQYLVSRFEADTLEQVDSGKYSKRNLWKMYRLMESGAHDFAVDSAKAVVLWLRKAVMLRSPGTTSKKPRCASVLRVTWNNRLLRQIRLREVALKYRSLLLYPRVLDDLMVVRKLEKPLGSSVFNYAKVSKQLSTHDSLECRCQDLFPSKFRSADGCVLTGDLGLVQQSELKRLLTYGPAFRTHIEADPMDAIKEALDDFISRTCADGISRASDFLPWKVNVLQECERQLKDRSGNTGPKVTVSSSARKYLRFLQHHLVLVPVDKAANNIAFICKAYYCRVLRNELLQAAGAYEDADEHISAILNEHRRYLESKKFEVSMKAAYLYWLPKLHKDPVGQRFIAGSADCSTTMLSSILSDVLTLILHTAREKDNRHIGTGGSRRFFVVDGYEEVASFLSGGFEVGAGTRLYTGDFSTMYTTIPHDDLIARVKRVTKEVWEWKAEEEDREVSLLTIRWTGAGAVWWKPKGLNLPRSLHSPTSHTFTFDELNELVSFLVKNTFIVNGDVCKRQACGIPMGTNCAPALANLYMYSYECEYIDQLPQEEAAAFHSTFRLIDDVLSVSNPYWERAISKCYEEGGLYPRCLQLNDTCLSPTLVNFLGMRLSLIRGRIDLDVFDKRNAFNFRVNRYPHMHSLIPANIPYGVFVGLLHRYYRICSQKSNFLKHSVALAEVLVNQGCSVKRLRARFRQFLTKLTRRSKWYDPALRLYRLFCEATGDL